MDSIHEAHLSRILEGRRRRGVLGEYSTPVAAPPPPGASYRNSSPPTPPPPPPPPPPRRVSTTAGTQTAEERKVSAAAQTRTEWDGGRASASTSGAARANGPSQVPSNWRQSVPQNNAAAAAPMMPATPSPYATLDGAVHFESPGRVPSLAYSSTLASTSPRRSSPWRPPVTAAPPPSTWAAPSLERTRRSIEPLPPPLYIPRDRSASRGPSHAPPPSFTPHADHWSSSRDTAFSSGFAWQPSPASARPIFDENVAPYTSSWRSRTESDRNTRPLRSAFHFSPLSIHREESAAAPLMGWPAEAEERRRPSRHHSRHHRRHHRRQDYDDGDDRYEDVEVDFPPRHHRSPDRGRSRAESRRRSTSPARRRDDDPRRSRGYAPPVVYMGDGDEGRTASPSSTEGTARQRRRSQSPGGSRRQSRNRPVPRPAEEQRKSALGLPDARSTMDLRTSIETLRAGDWFYKWNAKGDAVNRRWVWVDTKSYLLVWSSRETRNAHFCGDIRLDHICQVTSRDLMSVDEDGFPKTYYVLLIETTKRVLQLATELKDKCDAWFEALNNVMGFIHRNDIAKGALMPD